VLPPPLAKTAAKHRSFGTRSSPHPNIPLSSLKIMNWTRAIEIHWSSGMTTLIVLTIVSSTVITTKTLPWRTDDADRNGTDGRSPWL
jgi:hypothetical protein